MIILGMTGPIKHGKTTLSEAMTAIEPNSCRIETSDIIAEVGNAWHQTLITPPDPTNLAAINQWLTTLPPILETVTHVACSLDQLTINRQAMEASPLDYQKLLTHIQNLCNNFQLAREEITPQTKEIYRPLLQWLGGYLVQAVDQGIWLHEAVRRVKTAETNGCELALVGALRYPADANILRAAGGLVVKVYRPSHLESDVLDPTEREREQILPDVTVVNNGTVADLRPVAEQLYQDLQKGTLQPEYWAIETDT